MKMIKTYEGFLDRFRKKSEFDKIALEYIQRLKRVTGISPYEITVNTNDTEVGECYYTRYQIDFDDTPITIAKAEADKKYRLGWNEETQKRFLEQGCVKKNNHIFYLLWVGVAEEPVLARVDILEDLFNLTEKVYKENKTAIRVKKIRSEMNPAADLLNPDINQSPLLESLMSSRVTISEFVERIGIREDLRPNIIDFWNQNRSEIGIHLFPFQSTKPIAGVFLGTDTIIINERLPMPPHIKLFLAFHESRHCDQYREGGFMEGYYDTVVNGDREAFLQAYSRFERDANDFAISSMRACGFEREMNFEEVRLRGNERAGDMVYQMMSGDIQRLNPVDFFDLLKKQIGV